MFWNWQLFPVYSDRVHSLLPITWWYVSSGNIEPKICLVRILIWNTFRSTSYQYDTSSLFTISFEKRYILYWNTLLTCRSQLLLLVEATFQFKGLKFIQEKVIKYLNLFLLKLIAIPSSLIHTVLWNFLLFLLIIFYTWDYQNNGY